MLETVQLVASSLQTPNLTNLDKPEIKAMAEEMANALKNTKYVHVGDMVRTTAEAALEQYHASRGTLREWLNQSTRDVPSNTGSKGTVLAGNSANGTKLDQRDRVEDLIGTDIKYHCDNCDKTGYEGGTTLSGVYYAIRDHYCECRNIPKADAAGKTQTYEDIKRGVNNVVTGANQDNVPGGYVIRANAA
jgi:hypothetical protein